MKNNDIYELLKKTPWYNEAISKRNNGTLSLRCFKKLLEKERIKLMCMIYEGNHDQSSEIILNNILISKALNQSKEKDEIV